MRNLLRPNLPRSNRLESGAAEPAQSKRLELGAAELLPPAPKPRTRPAVVRPQQFLWAFPQEPPFEDEALPMRNAPAVDALGRIFLATQGRLSALVEEQGKPKVAWDYMLGSHVPGRIVVGSDGNVRAHAGDGLLHAVTPEGKQAFPPVQVGEPLGWSAPVVDSEGNTWISAYDGGLIRIDAEGPIAEPRHFRSRRKFDSAAVITGSVLYVGSEEGYIFAVDITGERAARISGTMRSTKDSRAVS